MPRRSEVQPRQISHCASRSSSSMRALSIWARRWWCIAPAQRRTWCLGWLHNVLSGSSGHVGEGKGDDRDPRGCALRGALFQGNAHPGPRSRRHARQRRLGGRAPGSLPRTDRDADPGCAVVRRGISVPWTASQRVSVERKAPCLVIRGQLRHTTTGFVKFLMTGLMMWSRCSLAH